MTHNARSRAGWVLYQARCTCGWRGKGHWRRLAADQDADAHMNERNRKP